MSIYTNEKLLRTVYKAETGKERDANFTVENKHNPYIEWMEEKLTELLTWDDKQKEPLKTKHSKVLTKKMVCE